jgi:hypothetical protein
MRKPFVVAASIMVALFTSQAFADDYDYDGCCCAPPVHYHAVVRYHAAAVLAGYKTVVQVSHVPIYKTVIYRTIHHYATYGCCG